MESILTSIKKLLGITEEDTTFDTDIIIHINSVLMILNQLGVGPAEGFSIEDSSAEWSDFIYDTSQIESVKTYVYMKVKLMFDPPLSSSAVESMKQIISELEWRLLVAVDPIDLTNQERRRFQNGSN